MEPRLHRFFSNWTPRRVPIAIKLALAIALLIVSGMSLLGFIILENQKTIMLRQIEAMGSTIAVQLANSAVEMVLADDTLSLQILVNSLVDEKNIQGVMIISEKGAALAQGGTVHGEKIISRYVINAARPEEIISFELGWDLKNDKVHELVSFVSPIHFQGLLAGHAVVIFSKNIMAESLHEARHVIIVATATMTVVAILLAFILSRHLSKPIQSLVTASKAIGEGDFHYRMNERRNDEIGELSLAFNKMADGLLKKSQVENIFSRYVSSSVAKKIMENLDEVELGGKYVNASVLFADIVGFTTISENIPPKEAAGLLNMYFSYISLISKHCHGHIDKFMGDCAMVVFGVPEHDLDHSFNAIACAVLIRKLVYKVNAIRVKRGLLPVHFRMGINTGSMVAGNLGSSDRMEYTVIGDSVNLASRLSSIAGSDQIVIIDELYQKKFIRQRVIAHPHATIRVRGKKLPVSTYLVDDIKADYALQTDTFIDALLTEYSAV